MVVNVSVTVPAVISAALGVYTALSVVLLGENVPVPPDHVAVVAEPPIVPASVTVLLPHIVCAGPASTVAAGLIVITTLSDAAGHAPAGSLVVSVSVTVPAATSAADGVYTAFSVLAFGANVPLPPLHVTVIAAPPIVPANVTVLPAHIVCAGPASTVATGSSVITTLSETAGHGPAGSFVVKVNVTEPAVISAALGVYTAVSVVLLGVNVPVPPDHVAVVAEPPIVPANVTAPLPHIVAQDQHQPLLSD